MNFDIIVDSFLYMVVIMKCWSHVDDWNPLSLSNSNGDLSGVHGNCDYIIGMNF